MKTAKQHNAPMVGDVDQLAERVHQEYLEERAKTKPKKTEFPEPVKEELNILMEILAELRAIREQLKTEVVTRDKFR